MIQIGQKVMVRDGWIKGEHMVPPAEVLDVAYEKNSSVVKAAFIQFENGEQAWFHKIALKTE